MNVYEKEYELIGFKDNTEPSIDEESLGKMDKFLETLDERTVALSESVVKMEDSAEKQLVAVAQLKSVVSALENTKASGIICTASGEVVSITDCSDVAFSNITVNGASEQYKGIGKNYLNNTASPSAENGITVTVNDDKSITVNGTPTITTSIYVGSVDLEAGNYIVSGNVVMSGDSSEIPYIHLSILWNDGEMGADSLIGVEEKSISLTQKSTVDYNIMLRANYALDNVTFYPMISVVGGEYEPYMVYPNPEYPQPIESVGDGGSLEIITRTNNLYSGGDQTFTQRITVKLEKPLQPGTYTVSAFVESTDTNSSMSALGFVGGAPDGGQIYARLTRGERVSSTHTIYNPVSSIWLLASSTNDNGAGDTATWTDIQIETGEIVTPYQPYKYDSITIPLSEPLRKYDKIEKQNGVCDIERGTKSVPFSGTWRARPEVSTEDGSKCYSSADFITDNAFKADMYMACTHLSFGGTITGIADVETLGKKNSFFKFYKQQGSASGTGTTMYVCVDAPTLEDFMAEMEGSVFEYELATPVFEPFHADVQEAIAGLHGYKPVTYITTDSEVEHTIDVEYMADTKIYIDNKFIELATALVAGSGV